ncbi:hypothetical protein [Sulfuritalea sp.]|uniref:hypothetical protein n=1 Tax=Sulfuritalea sp. TaxID=2480090 RepID=UPI001AC9023D|nr:hypothetical protein [Sulfuritalea sp.]MBN8474960.1 hypothetical protein [Sulfuritalea sp.]
MVTQNKAQRRKSSMHISVDSGLKVRLQKVAERMNIPVSHLTSLALSRAVRGFELEVGLANVAAGGVEP